MKAFYRRNRLLVPLLAVSLSDGSRAQCEDCVTTYCCSASLSFCCSYFAYIGSVLSGITIAGIVFGIALIMGLIAGLGICTSMCIKTMGNTSVDVTQADISTISHFAVPPPPYSCHPETSFALDLPPPYTATLPTSQNCPPPPPYPGYSMK